MSIYIDCVQGTPEWFEAKRGVPSASNFDRILTPKTCKPSSAQQGLIFELIADIARIGPPPVSYTNDDIRRGLELEPVARSFYLMERGLLAEDIKQVGFVLTDDRRFGCSPDSLVGEDGLLELKCPKLEVQAEYLWTGELPATYKCQVHGQLIVTGRKWVDFMSYSPGLDPFLIRVTPDEFTAKLREALDLFHNDFVAAKSKLLRGR